MRYNWNVLGRVESKSVMSVEREGEKTMLGMNNEEWSGNADQLLQQHLKKVQEECR